MRVVVSSLAVLVLVSCGSDASNSRAPAAAAVPAETGQIASALITIDELKTYDSRFLEIDACPNTFLGDILGCGGANWAGDANLYVGPDKDLLLKINKTATTTGTNGNQLPSQSYAYPGTATMDWQDLLNVSDPTEKAKHVRYDYELGNDPDPTAFPQSNSCVASSQIGVPKMDLTAVTVSNNGTYAYFGVQRKSNSGDAGYMWLFTKQVPLQDDQACGTGAVLLSYRLTDGDVMFRGHFVPDTSVKLLFVYTIAAGTISSGKSWTVDNTLYSAVCPTTGPCYVDIPAKEAINWENGLWSEKADGVAAAAVNTSPAGAGALGLTGVTAFTVKGDTYVTSGDQKAGIPSYTWRCDDDNNCMQPYVFAEVAVPTAVFTGGGAVCGATFYGSVISRPSGNNPTPDMKDLAGPYQFNFGQAAVSAVVSPSCDQKFTYKIDSFTGLGTTSPTTCKWEYAPTGTTTWTTFDSTCDSFGVTKTFDATTANLNGSFDVRVTAGEGLCSSTDTKTVLVYPALGASASLTGSCSNSFTYSGSGSGGSGAYTLGWVFSGPGTPTPSTSTSGSGSVSVSAPGTYKGDLTVTDSRTDLTCTKTANDSKAVYSPFGISLAASPASLTCSAPGYADISSDGTFTASASGGSGGTLTWHWTSPLSCSTTNVCVVSDSTTCGTQSVSVYATDPVCGDSGTKTGTYTKITTVTATVP